jgi:excisionase family DNA binding protein
MEEKGFPNILTAQHIANYLGISRRRVYELLQMSEEAGGIRCFQIGQSKRVDKEDFLQWIEQRKN